MELILSRYRYCHIHQKQYLRKLGCLDCIQKTKTEFKYSNQEIFDIIENTGITIQLEKDDLTENSCEDKQLGKAFDECRMSYQKLQREYSRFEDSILMKEGID